MKGANKLFWITLIATGIEVGCSRQNTSMSNPPKVAPPASQAPLVQQANAALMLNPNGAQTNVPRHQVTAEEIVQRLQREDEEYRRNPNLRRTPPLSEWPLPNFDTGPGRPLPAWVNFYQIDDRYPSYLLCKYDVETNTYSQTNEAQWFEAALNQIRHSGSKEFPPIKWIAVAIFNSAEHQGASTFEQSFKVGAIFNAGEVFDSQRDPLRLIAEAAMDRHPFSYDPQGDPTQRWVIVELHAATNHTGAGSQHP